MPIVEMERATEQSDRPAVADMSEDSACAIDVATARRRGHLWLAAAILLCPCHLPVTLGLLGALSIGSGLSGNVWVLGIGLGIAYLIALVIGFRNLRAAKSADDLACTVRTPGRDAALDRGASQGATPR